MIKTKIPTLEEMPTEIRIIVEYKMAVNLLRYKVDEINKKYFLPNINYNYFWNLESKIHETNKRLRGW